MLIKFSTENVANIHFDWPIDSTNLTHSCLGLIFWELFISLTHTPLAGHVISNQSIEVLSVLWHSLLVCGSQASLFSWLVFMQLFHSSTANWSFQLARWWRFFHHQAHSGFEWMSFSRIGSEAWPSNDLFLLLGSFQVSLWFTRFQCQASRFLFDWSTDPINSYNTCGLHASQCCRIIHSCKVCLNSLIELMLILVALPYTVFKLSLIFFVSVSLSNWSCRIWHRFIKSFLLHEYWWPEHLLAVSDLKFL